MDGFSHFVIQMHCLPVPWHESYPRTKKLSCILTIFFHFAFSCVIINVIDTFINRIYLYDDKLIITFNHKNGAETITLNDIETALTEQEDGSDLVSSAVPKIHIPSGMWIFCYTSKGTRTIQCGSPVDYRQTPARWRLLHNVPSPFRHTILREIPFCSTPFREKMHRL